ncbi:MAG TPA: DUF2244 domain-containing protein [Alphaproteobacteria bacterium]|nr:DUF2244 domain-containing protein [Alphaproteobacteria bacterium]
MSESPSPPRPAGRVFFDAVLMPHRSLSPTGFWLLMALISGISFVSGMFFVLRGAWPVTGYFGLDVLLIYLAFKASYRSARLYETIRLTEDALVVERVAPSGRLQRWSFQPYWLRVEIDDPPEHDSALVLTSHGRELTIGAFLTPEERLEVARALRDALDRCRNAGREAAWAADTGASPAG